MIHLLLLLSLDGTLITLEAPSDPKALAEVRFSNLNVNGPEHDGIHTIGDGELVMEIEFTWDAGTDGEDQVVVIPPDGVICIPYDCTATVPENEVGTVLLYEWGGT